MKLLIAVGGGGHFSPALAVIDQLPKDWDILLVGRKHTFEGDSALSFEFQTAQKLGLPFYSLTTGRLQRKLTSRTIPSLLKIPVGLVQSARIIQKFEPDVVISFGGYVSVPICAAAAFLKVPVVIHEQTLQAGLANKVAARAAEKICISWKESEDFFPRDKVVLTGNPLRKEFVSSGTRDRGQGTREGKSSLPTIYITGGSGGAHGINVLVEGSLERLLEKYSIVHQTGDAQEFGDFDRLAEIRSHLTPALQKRYTLKKFIDSEEVVATMSRADLVVSRSGINTVTELLYLGKPCLLIPLPHGQHNEQQTNALFVQKKGLGEVFDQVTGTPETFAQTIEAIVGSLEKYLSHRQETRALIHTDAAQKIIEVIVHAKKNT